LYSIYRENKIDDQHHINHQREMFNILKVFGSKKSNNNTKTTIVNSSTSNTPPTTSNIDKNKNSTNIVDSQILSHEDVVKSNEGSEVVEVSAHEASSIIIQSVVDMNAISISPPPPSVKTPPREQQQQQQQPQQQTSTPTANGKNSQSKPKQQSPSFNNGHFQNSMSGSSVTSSDDARFLHSPKHSCITLFRISEDALLDLLYDKNIVLRKAFYGDLVMKSVAAAEIWKILGTDVTPEVMQLKRSYYESNSNLAMFLIYGTDFKDICKKYRFRIRNRNLHSLGSILEALLWESNTSKDKSIYRLEEWKEVATEVMRWIDTYVVAADEDNRTVAQGLASIFDLQDNRNAFTSLAMAQQSIAPDGSSISGSQYKSFSQSFSQSPSQSPFGASVTRGSLSSVGKSESPQHQNRSVAPSMAPPSMATIGESVNGETDYQDDNEDGIRVAMEEDDEQDDDDEGDEEFVDCFDDQTITSFAPSTLTSPTYAHTLSPYNGQSVEVVLSKEYILANMSSRNSAIFNRHNVTGEVQLYIFM